MGVHVDPDFRVGERLSTRATEDLPTALAIVRAYLAGQLTGWALYSVRDSFRLTLSLALKSTDAALVEEAEVILNEIGARGMLEFRDLRCRDVSYGSGMEPDEPSAEHLLVLNMVYEPVIRVRTCARALPT